MHKIKSHFYILFLIPQIILAQAYNDNLSFMLNRYKVKNLNSSFNKQLNIYNFNGALKYGTNFGKLFIGINGDYNSTLIRSSNNHIKEERNFSLISQYNISSPLKIGILINNSVYSDNRKLDINQSAIFNTSMFTKLALINKIFIIPYGGISINKQMTKTDKGFIYGFETLTNKLKFSNLQFNSSFKFLNEDISPRRNTLRLMKLNLSNTFQKRFLNSISAKFSKVRKDFYYNADSLTSKTFNIKNNIQSRIESNYSVTERLSFLPLSSGFSFNLLGVLNWRDINRDTRYIVKNNITPSSFYSDINIFGINLIGDSQYRKGIFNGVLKFNFSERSENHKAKRISNANEIFYQEREKLEQRKNNITQQATLSLINRFNISHTSQLFLSLFHRKLRYDTPSPQNYDDRDELLTMFSIKFTKTLTPFFSIFINLEGSYNHIVYLFAQRSANNNIKRILNLSSGGTYISRYFTTKTSAEVSANYTVYDFEYLNSNLKSFSFRQFALNDSTAFRINQDVNFNFSGYIKLSEQGDFRWSNFSNRPQRFLTELYLQPKILYYYNNLIFGIGLRHFSLITFGYNKKRIKFKQSQYNSTGPLTEFKYIINKHIYVKLLGWYEFITTENNLTKRVPNMNLQTNWNF